MYDFIDNWLSNSIELAYQFEQTLHKAVNEYSDKSDSDRIKYLRALKYIDTKAGLRSESLDKAYNYLETCDIDIFWSKGLNRLKEVRQDIWDKLINNGTSYSNR